MIKLKEIYQRLYELEKDKWVDLKSTDKKAEYAEDIYDLISNAYASIGGHPNFKGPVSVLSKDVADGFEVIDLDDDPEIDAVSGYKMKSSGMKFVATGHDGSKPAKRAVINHKVDQLKMPGHYIEVSGRIKDILIAKGVPIVTNQDTIRRVMKDKEIEFVGNEGDYRRRIGGEMRTKLLLGKPK